MKRAPNLENCQVRFLTCHSFTVKLGEEARSYQRIKGLDIVDC